MQVGQFTSTSGEGKTIWIGPVETGHHAVLGKEDVEKAAKPAPYVTRTDLVKGLAAVAVGALVATPASVWLGVSTVDGALRIGYGYTLGAFFLAATLWRKARP